MLITLFHSRRPSHAARNARQNETTANGVHVPAIARTGKAIQAEQVFVATETIRGGQLSASVRDTGKFTNKIITKNSICFRDNNQQSQIPYKKNKTIPKTKSNHPHISDAYFMAAKHISVWFFPIDLPPPHYKHRQTKSYKTPRKASIVEWRSFYMVSSCRQIERRQTSKWWSYTCERGHRHLGPGHKMVHLLFMRNDPKRNISNACFTNREERVFLCWRAFVVNKV